MKNNFWKSLFIFTMMLVFASTSCLAGKSGGGGGGSFGGGGKSFSSSVTPTFKPGPATTPPSMQATKPLTADKPGMAGMPGRQPSMEASAPKPGPATTPPSMQQQAKPNFNEASAATKPADISKPGPTTMPPSMQVAKPVSGGAFSSGPKLTGDESYKKFTAKQAPSKEEAKTYRTSPAYQTVQTGYKKPANYKDFESGQTVYIERHYHYRPWNSRTIYYGYGFSPSCGMWDSYMLSMMLLNLNAHNRMVMYHNWDDPGMMDYRKTIMQNQANDAEIMKLKMQMAELEREHDQWIKSNTPQPGYTGDIPKENLINPAAVSNIEETDSGTSWGWIFFGMLAGGVILYLVFRKKSN